MQHEFVIDYDGKKEKRISSLVDFGIPGGDSSMARTVSLPLAIAVRMILDGTITQRGVIAPILPEIYTPHPGGVGRHGDRFQGNHPLITRRLAICPAAGSMARQPGEIVLFDGLCQSLGNVSHRKRQALLLGGHHAAA